MNEEVCRTLRGTRCAPDAPHSRLRSRRHDQVHLVQGFTLLEVLLAAALAAAVALAAAHLLAASRASETTTVRASDRARALDLAAGLLAGELRLAGHVPYPPPDGAGLDRDRPTLELTLEAGRHGDELGVRYVDDRVRGAPLVRDLIFDAAVDSRGTAQLYRAAGSGTRQPLVQGITAVRVVGWVDAAGAHPRGGLVSGPLRPWMLLLEIASEDATTRRLAAPLPNRPLAYMVMAP